MERAAEGRTVDLVVVDGGASRCRLAAFDDRGTRLATLSLDAHASLTLGEDEAWETVRAGIERLAGVLAGRSGESRRTGRSATGTAPAGDIMKGALDDVGGTEADIDAGITRAIGDPASWLPATLGLGLAGALQGERRVRFLARLERETDGALRCLLVTDGHAQLVGASAGRPGICLAVGTGSVVHWLDEDGAHGMAGGWGFPIGDEGSGAWLGARLLERYLWYRDGRTCASPLMALLDERIGGSVSDVQRVTTDARSTTHARLARPIVAAAEAGDALASSLLDDGAERCARLIGCAPRGLPVHVVGGLAEAYAARLAARLGERLQPPRGDVFDGLLRLVREPIADGGTA